MSLEAVHTEVCYQQTIRRELTHRAAVGEVFVTSLAAGEPGRFVAGAQLPRMHAYYGDHLGPLARRHDPLLVMEAARQTAIAITHEFYQVPLDAAFTVRSFNGAGVAGPVWFVEPEPTQLVLSVTVPRVHYRGGTPCGIDMILEISGAGQDVMTVDGSFSWMPPQQWTRVRAAFREELGMARTIGAPMGPGDTIAAAQVLRADPRNVVIGAPVTSAGSVQVELMPDTTHPFLFDHQLDHLPGSLLLEAARQTALSLLVPGTGRTPALSRLTSSFDRFVELDHPAYCRAELATNNGDRSTVRCEIRQQQHTAAELELVFDDAGHAR